MFSKFFSKATGKAEKKTSEFQQLADKIKQFLKDYRSDVFPNGILEIEQAIDVVKVAEHFVAAIQVPYPCQLVLDEVSCQLSLALEQEIHLEADVRVEAIKKHEVKNVKNIIAISSGKGGVGKSTTAVNLAYALIAEGATVGILDADIYGPSIPTMLGLAGQKPGSDDGKLLNPMLNEQLHAMSIGFLMEADDATVWRGPMASRALSQLLNETKWPELDYLIIDMPPGTGDIQLTLAQQIPVVGAVIVTTPQDVALADAVKGITMFNKVNVPILGVVENMSYHVCESCGHESHLFGKAGGVKVATDHEIQLLGQLPMVIDIMKGADNGKSPLISESEGDISQQYRKIAHKMAAGLYHHQDARSSQNNDIFIKEL